MLIEKKIEYIKKAIDKEIIEIPSYIKKSFKLLKKVSKKHNQYNACVELADEIIYQLLNVKYEKIVERAVLKKIVDLD